MAFGWRCKPRNSHRFGFCNVGKPEQIFFLDKFRVIHPKGLNSKGLNSKGLDLKRLKLKRIQAKGLNLKRLQNQKDSSASIQPHSDLSVKTSDYQHTRPGRRPRAATCAAALRHPALPKIITIITIITATTTTMHSALGAIK